MHERNCRGERTGPQGPPSMPWPSPAAGGKGRTFVFGSRQPAQQSLPRPPKVCPGGRGQDRPPSIGPPLGARGEIARKFFVFGPGQLLAHQAKAEEPFDIGVGQVLPQWPTQQQVSPRLPKINPDARGGGPGNLFAFGTTQLLGSPTPVETAAVPSDTPR